MNSATDLPSSVTSNTTYTVTMSETHADRANVGINKGLTATTEAILKPDPAAHHEKCQIFSTFNGETDTPMYSLHVKKLRTDSACMPG